MNVRLAAATPRPIAPASGLELLDDGPLSPALEARLQRALEGSRGEPPWRTRKAVEVRDLLALEAACPRLEILELDARTELVARLRLHVTVAVLEGKSYVHRATDPLAAELRLVHDVDLAVTYPPALLRGPIPGYGAVTIEAPRGVWHPNVSIEVDQRLCLGRNLPRAIPMRELVLLSFAALAMQSATLTHGDPAGVMNAAAVTYWSAHQGRLPLTRATLVSPRGEVGA